ncbi:MAG: CRISPR system precrRNA processing endoribonuclease RAMP protein Cas6 [Egibacteraceae bacterium]
MPVAYTLLLRTGAAAPEPTHEDLHRLACRLVEPPGNPAHQDQRKPFTLWPLQVAPERGDECQLRLNWLPVDDGLGSHLRLALGRRLWLGTAEVVPLDVDRQGTSYQTLRDLPPLWQADLRFLSPTYFSRSGRDYLLPDPALIVRSLVVRWNEQVEERPALAIDGDVARELGRRVILKAHELYTVRVTGADGRPRTGFKGQARLGLRTAERRSAEGVACARLLATLCAFVPYCGLGAQTTHGLGAVAVYSADG